MSFTTYGALRQEIERELDLEDEDFVQPLELIGYCNQAIKRAEALINELCEDYFLTSTPLTFVDSQGEYDLPSDVYANKIRQIIYQNGTLIYPIKRMRYSSKFQDIAETVTFESGNDRYRYLIKNSLADGAKINIYPTPAETGSYGTIWYLRNARQLTLNTTTAESEVVDIPEFKSYIKQFMKVKVYEKESHPNYQAAREELKIEETEMIKSLTDRIPDGDNQLEFDLTHYEEHI